MSSAAIEDIEHCSLCEVLDRVLNKGAVVTGELTISVANIDLIYLQLQLILTSVETARQLHEETKAEGEAERALWQRTGTLLSGMERKLTDEPG